MNAAKIDKSDRLQRVDDLIDGIELHSIQGYEGVYSISKKGDVWSYPKVAQDKKNHAFSHGGKWLKPRSHTSGYVAVQLHKNRKGKQFLVHRLVAETFLRKPEGKTWVNHKDGDKKNNDVDNLEWVTPSENIRHAFKTGLMRISERKLAKARLLGYANRKHSFATAKEIRRLYKTGDFLQKDLAEIFNIDFRTISSIVNNKSYVVENLTCQPPDVKHNWRDREYYRPGRA